MVKESNGMMVLTRCSAQTYVTSALVGSATGHPLSAVAIEPLDDSPSRPSLPQLIRLRHLYDLVLIPGFKAMGLLTLFVCKLLGKTCVLLIESVDDVSELSLTGSENGLQIRQNGLPHRVFLSLHKEFLRFIDAFITPSIAVADELVAFGIDRMIIHVIAESVDMEKFRKTSTEERAILRENLKLPVPMTIVTCAGRFEPFSDSLVLLRVWGEILRQHENVLLVLVDPQSPDGADSANELVDYARLHLLDECVNFIRGGLAIEDYLRASDIFVIFDDGRGQGDMVLEAMACELPLIVGCTEQTNKYIRQGQNGLIVDKDNFQQLFDAIETLLVYPNGAKRLGANARKTVEENCATTSVVEAYEKLFCAISQG